MKQLVYAILAAADIPRIEAGSGLAGEPIDFVVEGELAAACSGVAFDLSSPSTYHALTYAQVVSRLHHQANVLPLRLGCLMAEKEKVNEMLNARRGEFTALLARVAECVEMGVRILPDRAARAERTPTPKDWSSAVGQGLSLGPATGVGGTRAACPPGQSNRRCPGASLFHRNLSVFARRRFRPTRGLLSVLYSWSGSRK